MLKIEKFKMAREWLDDLPNEEFDMRCFYGVGECGFNDITDMHAFLKENGWLPCGTVCCLAGLIHWNAATDKQLVEVHPEAFASRFLGLKPHDRDAHKLFYNFGSYYGMWGTKSVTKRMVLSKLDEIISSGSI